MGEVLFASDPVEGTLEPGGASLAHFGRLCAAGKLAASFAHELQQPLCSIALNADNCLRLLQTGDAESATLQGALSDVHRQALRAAAVIKQLRRYVRMQAPAVRPIQITELVDRALALTDYEAKNLGVSTQVRIAPSLPPVLAEPVQIEQVLHNLIRNALDAIASNQPAVREIVIEARAGETAGVEVDVRDTAGPISETAKQQMFQPFFSTKRDGLGMGLYITRLIVDAHQCDLECIPHSTGTTMRLTFPAAGNQQALLKTA